MVKFPSDGPNLWGPNVKGVDRLFVNNNGKMSARASWNLEGNLPHCHFVDDKFYVEWSVIESGSMCWKSCS
jgi:hypothetical protein